MYDHLWARTHWAPRPPLPTYSVQCYRSCISFPIFDLQHWRTCTAIHASLTSLGRNAGKTDAKYSVRGGTTHASPLLTRASSSKLTSTSLSLTTAPKNTTWSRTKGTAWTVDTPSKTASCRNVETTGVPMDKSWNLAAKSNVARPWTQPVRCRTRRPLRLALHKMVFWWALERRTVCSSLHQAGWWPFPSWRHNICGFCLTNRNVPLLPGSQTSAMSGTTQTLLNACLSLHAVVMLAVLSACLTLSLLKSTFSPTFKQIV